MNRKIQIRLAATIALFAMAGCAAKPDPNTFGGRLALEGGEVASIGKNWSAAQKQVEDGRALVAKGKKRIDKGESQADKARKAISKGEGEVERGRDMIADGERDMKLAEEAYRRAQAAASISVTPALPPVETIDPAQPAKPIE
jgi:hypothetical protein